MKFNQYLSEISINKFRLLFNKELDDNKVVDLFKKDFYYSGNIKLVKVNIGGSATKEGVIQYSNRGILIHELFHLLQFKAILNSAKATNELKRYHLHDIENSYKFSMYVLQRKELNNQAISVAYYINFYNINYNIMDTKVLDIDRLDMSKYTDRLKLYFYHLNKVNDKKKKQLYSLIRKYSSYLSYMENLSESEGIIYGPTFIWIQD